jgi:hypothetical protein
VRHSSRAISPRDQRGDGSPRSEGAAKRVSSRATGVVWGLFDQFLSSATNLVGSIVAAQRLTKAGFGAWSVAFSLAVVMLGISRALAADPLTIRYSASTPQTQRLEISRVFAVPLVGGVAVGLVLAGTGLLLDSTLGRVLAVVGFSLPFLLFQDCCRLVLFMQGRAFSAAMNDLVWLIATVAALGLLSGRPSPPWLIGLCWTSGAALAAGFGYWQIGIRPGLSPGVWVKRHADLCLPFSIDFLLTAGVTYVVVFGLAAFRSVESTASFRGAQVLMGPIFVLYAGAMNQAAPLFARRAGTSVSGLVRLSVQLSVALVVPAVCWLALFVMLPERFGRAALGATWPSAKDLLPAIGLTYAVMVAAAGPFLGLRSQGDAAIALRVRLFVAPLIVVLGLVGAFYRGALGAAVGLLIANTIGLPIWWRAFLKANRKSRTLTDAAGTGLLPTS